METRGALSQPVRSLFRSLDKNADGLSVAELKTLDTSGDGRISAEEVRAAGIEDPSDIAALDEALGHARSSQLQPAEILFPAKQFKVDFFEIFSPGTQPDKSSQLPEVTTRSLQPSAPATQSFPNTHLDVTDSLNVVENRVSSPRSEPTPFTSPGYPGAVDPQKSMPLLLFKGVASIQDIEHQAEAYMQMVLPPGTSQTDIRQHIKDHIDEITQEMGREMNAAYTGKITMAGDIAPFSGFQPPNPKEGYVCTQIHAALAMMRQVFAGQEAYVFSSDQNEETHLITVYKDNGKWNYQNYDKLEKTDATSIEELTKRAIPGQRHLRLYKPTDDGRLELVRNELTDLGLRERLFRSQPGTGANIPDANGFQAGSQDMWFSQDGLKAAANLQAGDLSVESASRTPRPDGSDGSGWAAQIRSVGYRDFNGDAKYEWFGEHQIPQADGGRFENQWYANLHTGLEFTGSPDHSHATNEDVLLRLGGFGSYSQLNTFPTGLNGLDWQLGYQGKAGVTVSGSLSHDFITTFGGRSLYDIVAQAKGTGGLAWQATPELRARAGLNPGLDLSNIYGGFGDFGRQLGSVLTLDAYGEAGYRQGPFDASLLGTWNLKQPEMFRIGLLGQYTSPDQGLNATAALLYRNDPLLGNQFGLSASTMFRQNEHMLTGGRIGIYTDGTVNADAQVRYLY